MRLGGSKKKWALGGGVIVIAAVVAVGLSLGVPNESREVVNVGTFLDVREPK